MCTHYDGTPGGLAVDILVAQIEDQCGGAIKEPKHTNRHKKLCRGGEVALQVGHIELSPVTYRELIWFRWQPDGRWRDREGTFNSRSFDDFYSLV